MRVQHKSSWKPISELKQHVLYGTKCDPTKLKASYHNPGQEGLDLLTPNGLKAELI